MILETDRYQISRFDFARIAAKEYLRNFWWFFAISPVFGLIALFFTHGLLQLIGMTAILWPFSITARSILNTGKPSRLFSRGVRLAIFEDRLEFRGYVPEKKSGKPLRLTIQRDDIRDIVRRGRYVLVRTNKLKAAPIPVTAFQSEAEIDAFQHAFSPRELSA